MIVKSMNESAIYAIGHAFGYYDYGEETGMVYAFSGQEPTAQYICAYVRGMLRGGFLHTTSERGEGYIAYKRPKEKLGFKTLWPIATGMLHNSSMKRLMRFAIFAVHAADAVFAVAEQGMAEVGHARADLMRTAREQLDLQKRQLAARLERLV